MDCVCVTKGQGCKKQTNENQKQNQKQTKNPCFVVNWNRPARPGRRGRLGGIKNKVRWSPQLWLLRKWDGYLVTRHKNSFLVKAQKKYTRQSCKQYQTTKRTAAVNVPTSIFHPCLSEFAMCNLSQENTDVHHRQEDNAGTYTDCMKTALLMFSCRWEGIAEKAHLLVQSSSTEDEDIDVAPKPTMFWHWIIGQMISSGSLVDLHQLWKAL